MNANISYREVVPRNIIPEDWTELQINTGTQSTLQDIKTSEKAGGFCYKNFKNIQKRNRFIYWRTYQDVLELSEISLDISLLRNHLRMRFTDSAVLNVSVSEQNQKIIVLVVTVNSLHLFMFPFKKEDLVHSSTSTTNTSTMDDSESHSIFYDANDCLNKTSTYYIIDGTVPHNLPHTAASAMLSTNNEAFFAVAYQSKLMLYIMNSTTGQTTSFEVKETHLMPRFLSTLKGALIGRGEILESAIELAFSQIEDKMYLLALYRNDDLRLWSVDTLQNVCMIRCVGTQCAGRAQGPQINLLRKIDEHNYCIFLSHDIGAEFICVSIVSHTTESNAQTLSLVVQYIVPAPQMDLADFNATRSYIWALWSNAEGEFYVSTIFLSSDMTIRWVSAALEPPPERYCLTIKQGVDPKEAYCSYIFHPGRFDRNVIAKALYMFRRVIMRFDTKQLTMALLKEQICQAVDDEIQNEIKDFVVSDEEYLDIATRLWDRFYSCCEQYHLKLSEPIGLTILNGMDSVCVVRKQSFTLLRPCEILEHLMLIEDHSDEVATFVAEYCPNDMSAAKGFVELMSVITQLEKLLSEDMKMELDRKLYQQESPIDVVSGLVDQIITGDEEGTILPPNSVQQIRQKLQQIPNLESAVYLLLDILCIVDCEEFAEENQTQLNLGRFHMSSGALFGSEYGLSILAETVKQMAMIRFAVCRNLLILQYMLHRQQRKEDAIILSNVNFLKSYYTLVWIAQTPIGLNASGNFEASMQRLSRAQLLSGYQRPYTSNGRLAGNTTLLYLFLQSKGLCSALLWLPQFKESFEQPVLRQTLLQLVSIVNQLIWPDASNNIFLEWIFGTCHHIIIQDYVRILSSWSEKKSFAHRFILAVSFLDCGEYQKAVYLFEETAMGVVKDSFLFEHILRNTPLYEKLKGIITHDNIVTQHDIKLIIVHYYLKVIQLFEQYSALDYVIVLAQMAMSNLSQTDPHLPMFQSIVFNNHLRLEHYEEAYHALIDNADTSRRKDCLRQLVITLFECRNFDLLNQFPYTGLQEEFESIVESSARSRNIDQNEVYNFLYAYHANKGNMRKAATVMYEQALRLQLDSDASNALEKRCSALLVCINSMHLVDERYRWIARPTIGDEQTSTSRYRDEIAARSKKITVLEMADIRRELLHAEALKELSHHRKDKSTYELSGAEELSYLLASCGLYTAALRLTRGNDFSVVPIFESLTAACVGATDEKAKDAWLWLQENDLADLSHRNCAADMAWTLLQKLVVDNELNKSTLIRKCVVNRLLSLNHFIPQWLYGSYKLANSRELLKLFVKHNRLLEASELACEMICAMLGAGSQYFDFKHSLAVTNQQLAFPVNTINILMQGLGLNGKNHIEYEMARDKLQEELERYIETVKRITDDKIKLAILQNRENLQVC
ncbi:nuclear pore complex protein Nup160 homolog [Scaptodrosophila lebanonensis]|uniref:Nuclear pore complex protein Nup160 homolog n=1 Tax=Drosophila lebanonensis TaxID=7225 RepID=A0A6J2UA97_DROLE|nr:nuclear pore complex protein Nup160 homolog [Scaptodrosophila lebanonensis]